MPGVSDKLDAIESTLKKSLNRSKNKGRDLDQHVASSAQRLLQQNVEFVPAKKPHSFQLSSLKSKYILLKPSKKDEDKTGKSLSRTSSFSVEQTADTMMNGPGPAGDAKVGESLASPRVVIYPPEKVQLGWRQVHKVGGGLINMGNTCFMNATLQCLTYTPPLVNYCLSEEHPRSCKQTGFCLMCTMRQHVKTALNHSGSAFRPNSFIHKLKYIAKHFRHGRQEDAHEFLRLLVDGLQKACLDGHKKLDKLSKETTVIHQIFGGFLRSQVQCLKCSARSNTYEPFMDLSLNLKDVSTVEAALAKFVRPETLDSANAYACERCRQKTPARKRFSLHKIPNVLTIQLNRFGYSRAAGKINKHIQFPDKLNIRSYMSHRQGEAENYHLHAVLIHSGHHCNMGHYYCYIRAPSSAWYIMNDASVHPVSASRVFESQAYLLFYTKAVPSLPQASPKAPLIASTSNGLVSPKFNGAFTKQLSISSTPPSKTSGDVGVPVSRQMVSPSKILQSPFAASSSVPSGKGKQASPRATRAALLQNHMAPKSEGDNSPNSSKTPSSQRIVMQVKNGQVVTVKQSDEGPSKSVQKSLKKTPSFMANGDSTAQNLLKDSGNNVRERDSQVTMNYKDRNKENVSDEKKLARSLSDSSRSFKDFFKHKSDQSDVDGHHITKQQMSRADSDLAGINSTPKLKKKLGRASDVGSFNHSAKLQKDHSTTGEAVPPRLKKTSSDGGSGSYSLSGEEDMPKLRKVDTLLMNDLTLEMPKLMRVNSSPSVHNVWHVQPMDSVPSPSAGSSTSSRWTVNTDNAHTTPTGKKQTSFNTHTTPTGKKQTSFSTHTTPTGKKQTSFNTHTTPTDKKQKWLNAPWTVNSSGKRVLLDRTESVERVKKGKLSLPHQLMKDGQSSRHRDEHGETGERTKMNADTGFLSAGTEHSNSQTADHTSGKLVVSTQLFSTQSNKTNRSKASSKKETVQGNKVDTSPCIDSTPAERKHKKHRKKKKSHKQTDDESCQTENKSTSSENVPASNKQKESSSKLTDNCFNSSSGKADSGDSNSCRKKKRHIDRDMCDSEEVSAQKTKKRHIDRDMCDSEEVSAQKTKKRHIDRDMCDSEEVSAQKTKKLDESENMLQKTKKLDESENMLKENFKGIRLKKETQGDSESDRPVPVQAWDHYVKDSLGLKKKQGQGSSPAPAPMWDGSRTSQVVEELCKRAAVTTWNGEKSEAEVEAEKEEKRRKKKTWKDYYEEEIDRGKVKKVKKKVDNNPWAFNPFQKFQNHRNQEKFRWDEDFGAVHQKQSFSNSAVPSFQRSQSDMGFWNHGPSGNGSSSSSSLLQQNHTAHSAKHHPHPLSSRSYSVH